MRKEYPVDMHVVKGRNSDGSFTFFFPWELREASVRDRKKRLTRWKFS